MSKQRIRVTILLALMFGVSQCFLASSMGQTLPSETPQTFTPTNKGFDYVRRDVMIPMRDGVKLHTVLTPTLVLKDGQPFMVLSTPGGDNQDQALLQVLLNIVEFGMNPQEAVEAPRFDTQHYVSSFDNHEFMPGLLNIESRIPADVISQLKSRGHKLKIQTDWGTGSSPTVIMYNVKSGVISGGADPRRGRYAVAW